MRAAVLLCLCASVLLQRCQAGGPVEDTAEDRGLCDTGRLTAAVLAKEGPNYYRGVAERNFKGPVLGYVTPWNSHGYDVAVRWRAKFTHISPVWYQLRTGSGGNSFELVGSHNVDKAWLAKLRVPITKDADCADGDSANQTCSADLGVKFRPPRIVPRVILELAPAESVTLLQGPGQVVKMLVDEAVKHNYDGLVLEAWQQWASLSAFDDPGFREAAYGFFRKLAAELREHGKLLTLAVPPVVAAQPRRPAAQLEHLQGIASDVASFSLMTYDYSGVPGAPGPNAPLSWQRENVKGLQKPPPKGTKGSKIAPAQVLMGINFYGYDYYAPADGKDGGAAAQAQPGARAVTGDDVLLALKQHKPKVKWESEPEEHKLTYKAGGIKHAVYFPTPASLERRVQAAAAAGVGLAIWELGQGMDSFMDVL